ncbi:MAG TPA: GerMN domain-containing protein [Syntrophorhabdus sp.]|nr:GerMN domain-containing protein [Syntrophorhabdus sp.]
MVTKDLRRLRGYGSAKRVSYKRLAIISLPLLVATFVFVYYFRYMANIQPQRQVIQVEKNTVSLIYTDNNGKLAEDILEIENTATQKDKGDFIINKLKAKGLVPGDVSLQEMIIDSEGIIYLNFTKNLLQGIPGKDDIELTYAIVNSFLATFRHTNKVFILIDWKPVYTLRGVVYTYLPIEFNKQVMED